MSDLGADIRRYYESVVKRVDVTPQPVEPQRVVRHSLPTGLALALLVGLLVLALFGLAPLLLPPTPPADSPDTTGPETTGTTQRETITTIPTSEPVEDLSTQNPLLAPYFELDACGDVSLLEEWMPGAAGIEVRSIRPADLESVMTVIPILRAEGAACVSARVAGSAGLPPDIAGWILLDDAGELIARAVGHRTGSGEPALIDHPVLRGMNGEYHQDWIASGQLITGWVIDGMVVADINLGGGSFMRTTIEIPGYELPTEGRAEGRAGAELIGLLSLRELAPIEDQTLNLVPRILPDGVFRCMGPYWQGRIDPIPEPQEVTTYCDESGEVMQIGFPHSGYSPPNTFAETIEVSGMVYSVYEIDGGDVLVTGPFPPYGDIIVRSSFDPAEVKVSLESIPGLDARRFAPADGVDDYRSVFSFDWVAGHLNAIGATEIESRQQPPGSQEKLDVVGVEFRPAESSTTLEGSFWIYPPDEPLMGNPDANEIQTHEQVTVFVSRRRDQPGAVTAAMAYCGGVGIGIRNVGQADTGDVVLATLRSLITDIDC